MPDKKQKKRLNQMAREVRTATGKATKKDERKNKRDSKKLKKHMSKDGSGLNMGHSPAEMSPYKMGHSPAEMSPYKMGHESPAQNHHYGKRKGESVKQERKNLLTDNPVAKDASGGRPWIAKHFKSNLNMNHSPAEMGHSPAEMGHSPAEMGHKPPTKMKYPSPAGKHCM